MVTAAWAHDPITTKLTWSKEISRVVYTHCAGCHRPDGAAFSLLAYEEARPWAKAIRNEVLNRRMPPWGPVKGVGEFRDDPSLSPAELDLIVNWVEGGAPEGDTEHLPSPPLAPSALAPTAPRGTPASGTRTLTAPMAIAGIRPSGPVEVTAVLPDQRVLRLLWVRDFKPEWNRTYWLRSPVRLPRGSQLAITGSAVEIY